MTDTELLRIARDIVAGVRLCMAITVDVNGDANARVVQPWPPDRDWSVCFMTSRATRKAAEVKATGRLTLAYQHDAEGAYVALVGDAGMSADPASKEALWHPLLDRWFPQGPRDPDAVIVRLATRRVELWSYARQIVPEPRGFRAAVIERPRAGWGVLAQ